MSTALPNVESLASSKWIFRWNHGPHAKKRIFCFPWAGGGALGYRPWADILGNDVETCAIQLPGREHRLREEPITDLSELVTILVEEMDPLFDLPFYFFGHSLGSIIAFELCRALRRSGKAQPNHLFVSAISAPQAPMHQPLLHTMCDSDLLSEVTSFGGTPKAITNDAEMRALILKLMRADFTILEKRNYCQEKPLDIGITAFAFGDDHRAGAKDVSGWRDQTSKNFDMHILPGGHFSLKEQDVRGQLLSEVLKRLD